MGEAATHSMLRQPQWASESWVLGACSGAFQAGAGETNLATVGCLRESSGVLSGAEDARECECECAVVVEGRWGAPEMMTHNKPSSLN